MWLVTPPKTHPSPTPFRRHRENSAKLVCISYTDHSHNVFNSDIGCMQYWIYLAVRGQLVTFNLLPLCIAAPSKGKEPDAQPLPVSNNVLLPFHVHLQLTAPLLIVRLSINLHRKGVIILLQATQSDEKRNSTFQIKNLAVMYLCIYIIGKW